MISKNDAKAKEYKQRYKASVNFLEIDRQYARIRRARVHNATIIPFTLEQLDQRMSMFGHRCAYCGGPFEHVDHSIALARGGKHCLSNFRPACAHCNCSKWTKTPSEWQAIRTLAA